MSYHGVEKGGGGSFPRSLYIYLDILSIHIPWHTDPGVYRSNIIGTRTTRVVSSLWCHCSGCNCICIYPLSSIPWSSWCCSLSSTGCVCINVMNNLPINKGRTQLQPKQIEHVHKELHTAHKIEMSLKPYSLCVATNENQVFKTGRRQQSGV